MIGTEIAGPDELDRIRMALRSLIKCFSLQESGFFKMALLNGSCLVEGEMGECFLKEGL